MGTCVLGGLLSSGAFVWGACVQRAFVLIPYQTQIHFSTFPSCSSRYFTSRASATRLFTSTRFLLLQGFWWSCVSGLLDGFLCWFFSRFFPALCVRFSFTSWFCRLHRSYRGRPFYLWKMKTETYCESTEKPSLVFSKGDYLHREKINSISIWIPSLTGLLLRVNKFDTLWKILPPFSIAGDSSR